MSKNFLADVTTTALSTAIANEYLPKAVRFAGNVLNKYFDQVGSGATQMALSALTEKVGGGRQGVDSPKYKGAAGFAQEDGKIFGLMPKKEGTYPEWAGAAFRNPKKTAEIVGSIAPPAGLVGAGLLYGALSDSGKPRSDYAVPVQPSGGYNPNVEAANVSFQNQAALEEQKFRHHMALQAAREQARIPGPQNTSVGSYGGGPYSSGDLMSMAQGIANQKYKFG